MNCPSCGGSIVFLGTWDNAMQYRCVRCCYEIAMTKMVKKEKQRTLICKHCGWKIDHETDEEKCLFQ